MKLIVGLGNPGRKYSGTKHNVGYEVVAELARRYGLGQAKSKFQGEVVEADFGGQKALLLSPVTYMNLSGASVLAVCDFYKLPIDQLLVVCDDINLPLAKLRFRAKGSAGGQKGLGNIMARLATEEFCRLRVGIGSPPENWDAADYVLSKFTRQEKPIIEDGVSLAADAVIAWARDGIQDCMNQYN